MSDHTTRTLQLLMDLFTRGPWGQGYAMEAIVDRAQWLTLGKTYQFRMDAEGRLYYHDDLDLPQFVHPQTLEDFKPIVSDETYQRRLQENRLESIRAVAAEIPKAAKAYVLDNVPLMPGDVVMDRENWEDEETLARPVIVTRMLTREEGIETARRTNSLVLPDVLCYHISPHSGSLSFFTSFSTRLVKVGTSEEWGLPKIDPRLVERLTIYSMPKEES
ncbi:hypothetical protein LUCX_255 [Xanthomonas phage vB_XciM_LucasX]|nr:hypothetical protein LUCX_255 [Xanthomonas phage vB_XciM_LucasX]